MSSNIVEILIGAKDDAKLDLDSLKARLEELAHKVAEAKVKVAGDKEATLALDKLGVKLARFGNRIDTAKVGLDGQYKMATQLAGLEAGLDTLGKKAKDASGPGGLGALASAGSGTGAMGYVAAGAVALSPMILTLGFGLAGFGAAAAGAVMPIENAAKKTGGLQANMKLLNPEQQTVARGLLALGQSYGQFQKSLQPQVLGVFSSGLRIAGNLMKDVQPVAKATGAALNGLLNRVGAEFQSGTWQNFFGFMARTAGPDVKQLGDVLTAVLNGLPPLAMALQPVASGFLTVAADAAKAVGPIGQAVQAIDNSNHNISQGAKGLDAWTVSLTNTIPGGRAVNNWITSLQHTLTGTGSSASAAAPKMSQLAATTQQAAAAARNEASALKLQATALNTSLGTLQTYVSQTITTRNDLATLNKTLQASGDRIGYKTQKERDSFAAAQTFIGDTIKQGQAAVTSGRGIDAQIRAVQSSLGPLENVKGKTAAYNAELAKLKALLATLRAEKAITDVVNVVVNGARAAGSVAGAFGQNVNGGMGGHLMAAGGIAGAAAGGLRSGLTLVGEHGPELAELAAGSRVYNNSQTRQMVGQGGGGDVHYHINNYVSPLANPAEVGRVVVNTILEFERGSGKGWRS
jgi:hypothetical protein